MTARRGARTSPALGAAFLATQSLSLNAVSLFTTAFIVRRLGPLHFGEWAAASSLAAAHLVITNFGLRTLFVREIARQPDRAADLLAEQMGLRLGLGVLAGVVAMLVCLAIGYPPVVVACLAVGCVWILISVVSSTLGDVLQSQERFGTYSSVGLISGVAVTVSAVVAVQAGSGPVGLTVAYLAAPAVAACVFWREVTRYVHVGVRWDWERSKTMLKESRLLGGSSIVAVARDRAVQLLVPAVVGLEGFGVFSAGTMVAERLANVPDAVGTAFYPRVSRAAAERGGAEADPALNMLTIGLAACAPMAVAGVYLARPIAQVLLPHDTQAGAAVMAVTVLALPLVALSTAMSYCLQAAGHHDRAARSTIGASLVSVAVSVLCVAMAGVAGASWSLVARPAVLSLALVPAFHQVFPGAFRRLPLLRISVASAGLAAVCYLSRSDGLLTALGSSLLGLVIYVAGLLALRVFSLSDVVRSLSPTGGQR